MLVRAAPGQALLACSEEMSLDHAHAAGDHSHASRARHCCCHCLGLDGPGPWDRLGKGEEKCWRVCEGGHTMLAITRDVRVKAEEPLQLAL